MPTGWIHEWNHKYVIKYQDTPTQQLPILQYKQKIINIFNRKLNKYCIKCNERQQIV